MKKIIVAFIFIFISPSIVLANSGSANAHMNVLQNMVAVGTTGAFAAVNYAHCNPPKGIPNCILAAMSVAQMGMNLANMFSSTGTRDQLAATDFDWSNPDWQAQLGTLDNPGDEFVSEFLTAGQTGSTDDILSAINRTQDKLDSQLADIESKSGISVDTEKGVVNFPDGTSKPFSDFSDQFKPSQAALDLQKKRLDALNNSNLAKTLAGSGDGTSGGGGGVAVVDEVIDLGGGGSGFGFGKGSRGLASTDGDGKNNDDFLAALSEGAQGGVGVAGDNLFKMMSRRFNSKKKKEEFIKSL